MKKILIVFLMIVPFVAVADSGLDIKNQMLDSEIERLTNERDTKYEALQKCEKSTKGFKIAGITTLVATGVGVYGNIKLAQKLSGKSGGGSRYERPVIKITEEDQCAVFCGPPDGNEEICADAKKFGIC